MYAIRSYYVTREDIQKDVELVKQFNFNAIRTCHYPNDPYFYELCNKYGIYVMDEANIECHHLGSYIPYHPNWTAPILSRIIHMVERDKNEPCVISWSLGNESGTGPAFAAAAGWVRNYDTSRFIHYEGAQGNPKYLAYKEGVGFETQHWPAMANPDDADFVDVISRMYSQIHQLKNLSESPYIHRPIIMCEYMHAMGNSMGTLGDYWDLIRSKPNLIGGFVWDMIDQGIEKEGPDGKTFFAYGGDFGDIPNEANFCLNGVFASDRTPNPHAWECKYVFQPVSFKAVDMAAGLVRIVNRFNFTTLANYEIRWTLSENGKELQSGILPEQVIPAGDDAIVAVPFNEVKYNDESEYWLRLSVHEKADRLWCKKGYEVAKDQLLVHAKNTGFNHVSTSKLQITVNETDSEIAVLSGKFSAKVSKETGELVSYKVNGNEQLISPLRANFSRPLTDNDRLFRRMEQNNSVWIVLHNKLATDGVKLSDKSDSKAIVEVKQSFNNQVELTTSYTFFNDGNIAVKLNMDADSTLPNLIKFGVTMGIPDQYNKTTYYGNGPFENYIDRNRAAEVDEYSETTDAMFHNYAMPQENGNRTATRWLKLSNENGKFGIKVVGAPEFEFSVWPYSLENIHSAQHPYDLIKQGFYTLNIDYRQTGVGGKNAAPLDQYLIQPGKLDFGFVIMPLND